MQKGMNNNMVAKTMLITDQIDEDDLEDIWRL